MRSDIIQRHAKNNFKPVKRFFRTHTHIKACINRLLNIIRALMDRRNYFINYSIDPVILGRRKPA